MLSAVLALSPEVRPVAAPPPTPHALALATASVAAPTLASAT